MGSGTSRGKKVAPASCVSEIINVPKRDDTYSPKLESHSFRSLKIPSLGTKVTNAMDCHSEGHDSDCSVEDDHDIIVESDRVLASYDQDHDENFAKRKNSPRKSYIRSKTYGLCNFRRVHHVDGDFHSTPHLLPTTELCEEPRGPDSGSVDVNKKSNGVFGNFRKHTPPFQNGSLTKGPCVDSLPRSEQHSSLDNCHGPSLTMPVLFDGSEEELMDTIEREFS